MSLAKNLPQIDSLYVYNITRKTAFHHRIQEAEGYRYKNRNVLLTAAAKEINIYHQSAEVNGVLKGITIVTKDSNKKRIKKFFKDSVEQIKKDDGMTAIFNAAINPVQIDIFHLY